MTGEHSFYSDIVPDHAHTYTRHYRESFPPENIPLLRELLLELTSHSVISGKNKVILRKLFIAASAHAPKLYFDLPGCVDHLLSVEDCTRSTFTMARLDSFHRRALVQSKRVH